VTDKPAARRIDPLRGKPVPTDWNVYISEEIPLQARGIQGGSSFAYRQGVPKHARDKEQKITRAKGVAR
jgi:hypothetical protein